MLWSHSSSSNLARGKTSPHEVNKNFFDQFNTLELLSEIYALTEIQSWNVQFCYIVCDEAVYFVALIFG